MAELLESYMDVRSRLFKSRFEARTSVKIMLALGMAVLTGLLAQLRIPLPYSPVPITGQTFGALLAGVILGAWWGGISMTFYVLLGILGVPWFNGFSGGVGHLLGPTGGYIIGFIAASLVIGYVTDRYPKVRGFLPMLTLMLISNFVIIYGLGLIQLGLWLSLVKHSPVSLPQLLWMGTIPFIAGDVTKAVAAALIAKGITSKEDYKKITN